ncbi:hypothetical protein BH10ACT2_BH10ACT2_14280 [soil metagenome]
MMAAPHKTWSNRTLSLIVAIVAIVALVGCGSGSSADPASTESGPSTTDSPSITTVVVTTAAATTTPPTTLPPTLTLSDLPGTLAILARTCGSEVLPESNEGTDAVICTMKPDGSGAQQVSEPGETPSGSGEWTYDGVHFLYSDPLQGIGTVIVDLATGQHRVRARGELPRFGMSPDGLWLVFSDVGGLFVSHSDLSSMPDGTLQQQVVSDNYVDFYSGSTWSPDGTQFAYLSTSDGSGGESPCNEVWVGNRDGSPPTKVTTLSAGANTVAACPESIQWSADGSHLLMLMDGLPQFTASNVYVMNVDGSGLLAITHGAQVMDENLSPFFEPGTAYDPEWSPDGKQIVFQMSDGQRLDLYIANADGSQLTRVGGAPAGMVADIRGIAWALG